ncbi:hypothetical protein AsAng_0028690 [Aureispira anguillae]|uniref:Uncharacterized protein n=1 Tax=Aureispira anguillae TaxID=2864201 RepID=A0A915YFN2_9BACT|nr:hypothetical protein AsAng_0028690 [Aureispira anguillae]
MFFTKKLKNQRSIILIYTVYSYKKAYQATPSDPSVLDNDMLL